MKPPEEAMTRERAVKMQPQISTRKWDRITIGSTKLISFGKMRMTTERVFGHFEDGKTCMWEIVVKFPPKRRRTP